MTGLLADVLPFVFSQSDRAKRYLGGLLGDPIGTLQQTAGGIVDAGRAQQGLLAQAFADPKQPFQVTDSGALNQAVGNVMAGPMGFAPAGIFAGVGAKTANNVALAQAQKRVNAGADPAQVWAETGWGKGPDGKWRFEVDDSAAKNLFTQPRIEQLRDMNGGDWISPRAFAAKYPNTNEAGAVRLRDSMYSNTLSSESPTLGQSFSHPQLMDAYPDMYRTKTVIKNDMPIGEGGYAEGHDAIVLSPMAGKQADNVMLHELQHAVQQREGFALGGTPDLMVPMLQSAIEKKGAQARALSDASTRNDPLAPFEILKPGARAQSLALEKQVQDMRSTLGRINEFGDGFANDAYQRLGGEAEARLVQARADMSPAERAAQFPWDAAYFRQATGVPLNGLLFPR